MTHHDKPNDPDRLTPTGSEVRRTDAGRDDLTYNSRTTGSFWPWIVGLIVLLAIGWIVIEAFDQDTQPYDGAVPAAGEVDEPRRDYGTGMNGTGTRTEDGSGNEDVTRRPAE